MSAAPSPALEKTSQRVFPRHPIKVALDVIALRSGVPETLPGRCTDISEAGVGAIIAGELAADQPVAVELRLPNVGVPVRARALVRYQSQLHCGLEFVGLASDQREMIRYWVYRASSERDSFKDGHKKADGKAVRQELRADNAEPVAEHQRAFRIRRRRLYLLFACALVLAALGWWEWQRSWSELEKRVPVSESRLQVSSDTMDKRIVTKIDPTYPETARSAGTEGLVVLDAVIAQDGSVKRLRTVSGPNLLAQSATEAVQLWKFEPYLSLSTGKPVEVETTIAVEFRLN
jgi:TonB family protein